MHAFPLDRFAGWGGRSGGGADESRVQQGAQVQGCALERGLIENHFALCDRPAKPLYVHPKPWV
jgi:hypothetical protein